MGGLRARRRSSSRPVSGWVGRGLAAQRSAWGFWFRPNMPLQLPAATCGNPMTYMVNGKQYIAVSIGAPAELVALALP